MQAKRDAICIVGAGQAGCELALGLRQNGWSAAIALIGEEAHPPYQRPALSKAYLKGHVDRRALFLRQPAAYERANVELLLNSRVECIDRNARTIRLSTGEVRHYAQLALATGGRPRKLSVEGAQRAELAGNLHYLRTIDDVGQIRARFAAGSRLVIVGGGYIGLEAAAAAVAVGLKVTVLEALPRVLARVTAPEMSAFFERVHLEAGVDVRTGVAVRSFEFNDDGTIAAVNCADGSSTPADLFVVGVGLVPNTDVAEAAGLAVDDGIVVDEHARTSDAHIVAAGDCTNHPSLYGRRVRLESVQNAVEQARTAAATLAGRQHSYHAIPWFWSDQYDLKLQMAGLSQGYDQLVLRGLPAQRSFAMFYLKDDRLLACDAVNRPQEFMASKRLIAARSVVDPAALADDSASLRSAVGLPCADRTFEACWY